MAIRLRNRLVFAGLVLVFALYSVIVYTQESASSVHTMGEQALAGEKLWQEHNCTACHQLYGLGGYLGPDLTNVVSSPYKNELYLKSFFDGGVGAMPNFRFTNREKDQLIAFLRHVDSTGYYPLRDPEVTADGWVTIQYK